VTRPGPIRLLELEAAWRNRAAVEALDPGPPAFVAEVALRCTGNDQGPWPPATAGRILDELEGSARNDRPMFVVRALADGTPALVVDPAGRRRSWHEAAATFRALAGAFTDAQLAGAAAELVTAGERPPAIARRLGVSTSTIRRATARTVSKQRRRDAGSGAFRVETGSEPGTLAQHQRRSRSTKTSTRLAGPRSARAINGPVRADHPTRHGERPGQPEDRAGISAA
jgi:hypothetical protein